MSRSMPPLRVILSAGQIADIEQAEALISGQSAEFIVADKGYDSDAFVEAISAQGSQPVIPPRSNRLNPRSFILLVPLFGWLN